MKNYRYYCGKLLGIFFNGVYFLKVCSVGACLQNERKPVSGARWCGPAGNRWILSLCLLIGPFGLVWVLTFDLIWLLGPVRFCLSQS